MKINLVLSNKFNHSLHGAELFTIDRRYTFRVRRYTFSVYSNS